MQAAELVRGMPGAFLPEKAGNAQGTFHFILNGEGGGEWALEVANGQCQVREGTTAQPNATVTMEASDFVRLYQNQMNPVQAFMAGKIKVTGNMGLMMQFLNWFKR